VNAEQSGEWTERPCGPYLYRLPADAQVDDPQAVLRGYERPASAQLAQAEEDRTNVKQFAFAVGFRLNHSWSIGNAEPIPETERVALRRLRQRSGTSPERLDLAAAVLPLPM